MPSNVLFLKEKGFTIFIVFIESLSLNTLGVIRISFRKASSSISAAITSSAFSNNLLGSRLAKNI